MWTNTDTSSCPWSVASCYVYDAVTTVFDDPNSIDIADNSAALATAASHGLSCSSEGVVYSNSANTIGLYSAKTFYAIAYWDNSNGGGSISSLHMRHSNSFSFEVTAGTCTTSPVTLCGGTAVTYISFASMYLYSFDSTSAAISNTVLSWADYATGYCNSFTLEDCLGNSFSPTGDLAIGSTTGTVTFTNVAEFRDTACINACGVVSTSFTV